MKPTLNKFLKHFLFVGGDSYSWKGTLYYIVEDPRMFSDNQTSVYQANRPNNEDKDMIIHRVVYRENNGEIPVSESCEVDVCYSDGELRTVIAGNVSWEKHSGVFIRHWRPSLSYVSNTGMKPRYKMMWGG